MPPKKKPATLHAVRPAPLTYELVVELDDTHPRVWRRIVVPATIELGTLHTVIRTAIGWESGEVHEFVFDGFHYGEPHPIDPMPEDLNDETDVSLRTALGRATQFEYLYDYHAAWWHSVRVKEFNDANGKLGTVRCLGGENACPPTGFAGVDEYREYLDAVDDPQHERHDELLAIALDSFDPTIFDIDELNRTFSLFKIA